MSELSPPNQKPDKLYYIDALNTKLALDKAGLST
jgi:hypothetical protein